MSMYRRVHTPNSPLLPLSPMVPISASPSMYLSPYTTSIRSRRSFTPSHLNVLPPPSLSPIKSAILSAKSTKRDQYTSMTPNTQQLECSLIIQSSAQKSMKKIRSVARINRKVEARKNRLTIPLTPLRRSLFVDGNASSGGDTPDASSTRFITPISHKHATRRFLTPAEQSIALAKQISTSPNPYGNESGTTPNVLEETFTILSILKEIHMGKYAKLFAKEEIDLFVFLLLTPNDVNELGIDELDRDIILGAVDFYKEFLGNPEDMYF